MAYSLFDEDEKIKLNDTFNSLGFPTSSSVTESSKSSYDDIDAQNKALENIIARQNMDEQAAKDDYNSFGSRANRFVQVLGAGLMGENASGVAKDLRDNLNTRLTNIRSKYKDERDSAYQRVKDTLARREALNKLNYEKDRDRVKDEQSDRDYKLKVKTQADQNAIAREQLDILRNQANEKRNQAIQAQEQAAKQDAQEFDDIQNEITDMMDFDSLNPKDKLWTNPDEEISSANISKINLMIAKHKFGMDGEKATKFISEHPELFPQDNDYKDVIYKKWKTLGYGPKADPTEIDGKKVKPGSKKIKKDKYGNNIRLYELEDGTIITQ